VYTSASALPREWKSRDSSRLLLVWLVVVLGVLSAAHEQKLWYAMSVFPALALLAARALAAWLPGERQQTRVVLGGFALAGAAGAFLALTPFGAPPPRRPDIQALAEVAKSMLAVGEPIVFGGGNYYSVAHQFVFYSDALLLPGSGDADVVRAGLDAGRWALVDSDHYKAITGSARPYLSSSRYPVVARAGDWALVHRAPAPPVYLGPSRPAPEGSVIP
jgi:hypothetical protein